jgi:glutaminase
VTDQKVGREYVSTGHLPSPRQVQVAVDEAYRLYRAEASGATSQTYPALARASGHLFGICVAGVGGSMYRAGDSGHEFTIMSVAKPFVFALVCETLGAERARQQLGVNATGLAFDSLTFVERSTDGRSNPMVNAGAIAATSLVQGETSEEKWKYLADGLSRFAGRDLTLSDETYASASATNHRNRAIANLLASRDRIYWDPAETVDLYTRQSCLLTSAEDLAVMTATLADGGVNPVTGRQRSARTPASTRWPSWPPPGCTRPRATGFSTSECPARAESRAGSSRSRRARAAWGPSPRSSTRRGTACGVS